MFFSTKIKVWQRRLSRQLWLCCVWIVLLIQGSVVAQETTVAPTAVQTLDEVWQALAQDDLTRKQLAVTRLAQLNPPQTEAVFSALLDGRLMQGNGQLWVATGEGEQRLYHPVSAIHEAVTPSASPNKVGINNAIRQWIKNYLAEHALLSPEADKRLAAMVQMMDKTDASVQAQVQAARVHESDARVRRLMDVYAAKMTLTHVGADESTQAQAVHMLANSSDAQALAALQQFFVQTNSPDLKQKAQQAMVQVQRKMMWLKAVETVSFGLSLGSVLVLCAIGLAITFGVMGVINMAHGELMMIGAYCAYVMQLVLPQSLGWSLILAVPLAFVVSGLMGMLIERLVVRYLYGRPLETLLATFGVSLVLQQLVRSVFSPLNRMVQSPTWMSGAWDITAGLSLTWNRVVIVGFCLVCFLGLWLLMNRTRLGLEVKAVAQNRPMARAMGIGDRRVDALTFGLGSGVAGVAGVALSQLTNVGPELGQAYIVDSFMVVVVGGVGNLWGTLVSGLTLGVLNKFLEPWAGAVLAKVLVLVLIIVFIQKYPRGLFPQKGRAVE